MNRWCPACGAGNPAGSRFCGDCGARLEQAAPSATLPDPEAPGSAPREERRWVTVLFADLSGFTAMAERMDPEDLKAVADRCLARLGEEVQRFDGTVIHVPGDELVVVFGAPVAHEDDAERAVRAALAMQDCSLSDDAAEPIRVHIGIDTGEVMAGYVGPVEQRRYTVIGDPVNTAARLRSAAQAGSVLVGEETYGATRRAVRYRELPAMAVRGKEQPVRIWEALEVAPVPVGRPLGGVPVIGRDTELTGLADLWHRTARQAEPHLVTLLGEPGIGKSRLAAEFERRVLDDARVIHGRCLPYGEALGYRAWAMALREAAGLARRCRPTGWGGSMRR